MLNELKNKFKKIKIKRPSKTPRIKEVAILLITSIAVIMVLISLYFSKYDVSFVNVSIQQSPIPEFIQSLPSIPRSPMPSQTPSPTTTPSPATTQAPPPTVIYWSATRRLTWNDFQATMPDSANSNAEIATKLEASWLPTYTCADLSGRKSCTVKVSEINAFAAVNTSLSWVREGQKIPRILNHEQTHFDINEIHARKAREQTGQFLGQTETAEADNERAAVDQAAAVLDNRINPVIMQIQNEADVMQDRYDNETAHGTNSESQSQWDQNIRGMLGI